MTLLVSCASWSSLLSSVPRHFPQNLHTRIITSGIHGKITGCCCSKAPGLCRSLGVGVSRLGSDGEVVVVEGCFFYLLPLPSVKVEDNGSGLGVALVKEGEVCVGGTTKLGERGQVMVGWRWWWWWGLSRIDQALEEVDCATFEDEGTIMLLGSVSHRRGSQTTRGKAL